MSNNAPDYNDNLVFPPRHDKTAYELQIENSKLKEQLAEHKENCCCAKNEVLILENANLKELLKECQEIIEWYKADCGYKDLPTESVLTKIDEVQDER